MSWQNWAGTAHMHPAEIRSPATVTEVVQAVDDATTRGLTVRMVGAGHSFTDVAVTDGILLQPQGLNRVRGFDLPTGRVTVDAGLNLTALCEFLDSVGLALTNMGDVRVQSVAGATQTSTHGTGRASGTLAQMITALELVLADGSVVTVDADHDPDLFNAARVGLGAFGIVTAVTLQTEPAFRLHAHEGPAGWDEVLTEFDGWTDGNDHVEFYWFPHTDGCTVKWNNRTYDQPEPPSAWSYIWEDEILSNGVFAGMVAAGRTVPHLIPALNRTAVKALSERRYTDVSWRVFTSPRRVRFREMEYALPRENLLAALVEVRNVIQSHDWRIGFPCEIRSVPGDEPWLSTAHGRDTGYIAFHVPKRTDHHEYFETVEVVLREAGGRPHWGKLHTRAEADLADAYPMFRQAQAVRDRVDPQRRFRNAYVTKVLGP